MKIRSILLTSLISTMVVVMSCSGQKTKSVEGQGNESSESAAAASDVSGALKPQFTVDAAFQQQLAGVLTAYLKLKDAFVSSDAGKVKAEASETQGALAKVDMKLLKDAAHHDWMIYLAPLESSLKDMQAASDIAAQRKSFSTLSDNLYKSVKAFGVGGKEVYYEFCPMALNNEGAYWLSEQEKIRNPYFGDMMLTCGSVVEKLK